MIGRTGNIKDGVSIPLKPYKQMQYPDGDGGDIVKLTLQVYQEHRHEVADFAKRFPRSEKGLHQLYWYVKKNFRYVEDTELKRDEQWVQTPANLFHNGKQGDCKSYTIFIGACLHALKIPHIIRFVWASKRRDQGHVYPIAILDGKEIVIDAVIGEKEARTTGVKKDYFNYEVNHKIKDDFKMAKVYKVGAIAQQKNVVKKRFTELRALNNAIPDRVVTHGGVDYTQLSEEEFARKIMYERHHIKAKVTKDPIRKRKFKEVAKLIASPNAQVKHLSIAEKENVQKFLKRTKLSGKRPCFCDPGEPMTAEVSGLFKKIKGAVKKVKGAFKKIFKKLVNGIFKQDLPEMAPYFLFQYIPNKEAIKDPEVKRRIAAQQQSLEYIAKSLNTTSDKFVAKMYNDYTSKYGQTPDEVVFAAMSKGSSVGVVDPVTATMVAKKAFPVVKKVLGKVFKFMKNKKKMPPLSENDASDLSLLRNQEGIIDAKNLNTDKDDSGKGGSNTGLIVGGLLIAGALGYAATR